MRLLLAIAPLLSVPGRAAAQPADVEPAAADVADLEAARGTLLPWTGPARHDGARAVVSSHAGWNGARDVALFESTVDVRVARRVGLRGGAVYLGDGGRLSPVLSVAVDALREAEHRIDLAIVGGYEAEGFNLTPAVVATIAAGWTLGDLRMLGQLGLGIGTEEGERYGDLRAAALRRVAGPLRLGIDARARIDLERDADEPPGEPAWEVLAGPVATYPLGRFVVTAGAGVAAFEPRLVGRREVGVQVTLGVGVVVP